ncbi:TonB-dependent receptor plug domain-containing protein [Halorhodospira halophila]|uniref:TonB-dependent receptor n=1 Tax=Halorhodospira halophila (strain DSM 244 / SL1) TaxID=349124 RepID=A1WYD0_HALHL|nr:TonB-dependent receptor [Halorhodospira halophila]ABM62692.1 TonB-dependent receptor [Halorhodospira halophila SL1]MBK1728373.1 TonB-dependent receptor [Halorhodospira halophila]
MATGQPIARALLSGAAALPLMATPKAGSAEEHPTVLPDLTVTAATRTERQVERTPAATEILSGDDIRRSGAAMLDEALQAESSIYTGVDGNTFSIRGGNRDDMLYLIDGRRIAGTSSRSNELNRIPVSHVERIEIVKGPGSVVYGADAVAGVINVITRRPEPGLEGGVSAQAGTPTDAEGGEQYQGGLYLGGGTQDTRFRLFADALEREAYSEETTTQPDEGGAPSSQTFDRDLRPSADVYTLRGGVTHWFTDRFHIDLEAGFLTEERQERLVQGSGPGNIEDFAAVETEESDRRDLAATAEWLATENLELRYQAYESHYKFDRVRSHLAPQDFASDAADRDFGFREATFTERVNDFLAQWQPAPRHTVLTGLEHKQQIYQDLQPEDEPEHDQWVGGGFLQHEWQATDRLDLVYGARHDETSTEADSTSLQAGAVYRLAPEVRLRAQYAEGFKLPELRSFYVDTEDGQGREVRGAYVIDPDVGKDETHELDPESSRNYEFGIAGDLNLQRDITAFYDIGLFYTEYDDRIGRAPGNGYQTFKNVDSARAQGAELKLGAAFDPQLELTLAATYLDAIDRDSRETLTDTPEWTAVAKALWTPTDPLEVQLRTRYVDEVRVGDDWDSAYTLTGLDVAYAPAAWDGLRLQGGIENLLDEGNDSSLRADPGRFARAGVRYDF